MKKTLFILLSVFLFASCIFLEFDQDYEVVGIASWVWWVLGIGIVLFVILGINGSKQIEEVKENLEKKGIKLSDFIKFGSYVGGHPSLNDGIKIIGLLRNNTNIDLYDMTDSFHEPIFKTSIKADSIKSIDVEDASTIDKKVTLGRILLVGIFALAWRKKKKNEIAFVVVSWNDGRFDHDSTFCFEGQDAMLQANTARNSLIKSLM